MITEVAGVLALVLSRLPDEKKQAIKNEVLASIKTIFPSRPVKLTAETILGAGTRP